MTPGRDQKRRRVAPSESSKGITKPGTAKREAKSLDQKKIVHAIQHDPNLTGVFANQRIAANIASFLPVKERVILSGMNSTLHEGVHDSLYTGHAETMPYKTSAAAAKKTDTETADSMFEEVRQAVDVSYQLLIEYLNGGDLDPDKYGITQRRWADFLAKLTDYQNSGGTSMHPSTAAGYIVEDITTHILETWTAAHSEEDKYNFQDTEIMGGISRPDITADTEHRQKVLLDITSSASSGHILDKEGNWLSFPHVAELLYPAVNFSDPSAITPKMTETERKALLARAIRKQVESESSRYAHFLDQRAKYYQEIENSLARLFQRGSPSARQLRIFQDSNQHVKVNITGDSFTITVDSFTSIEGNLSYEPWEGAPPSPPHYSMSSHKKLKKKIGETSYPSKQAHSDMVTKKFDS
jgi:hypothetical protein